MVGHTRRQFASGGCPPLKATPTRPIAGAASRAGQRLIVSGGSAALSCRCFGMVPEITVVDLPTRTWRAEQLRRVTAEDILAPQASAGTRAASPAILTAVRRFARLPPLCIDQPRSAHRSVLAVPPSPADRGRAHAGGPDASAARSSLHLRPSSSPQKDRAAVFLAAVDSARSAAGRPESVSCGCAHARSRGRRLKKNVSVVAADRMKSHISKHLAREAIGRLQHGAPADVAGNVAARPARARSAPSGRDSGLVSSPGDE